MILLLLIPSYLVLLLLSYYGEITKIRIKSLVTFKISQGLIFCLDKACDVYYLKILYNIPYGMLCSKFIIIDNCFNCHIYFTITKKVF